MLSNNEILRMILGFKVRYLRQKQELSYQELAEKTGLSTSYLNDIEKGKKYPSPGKVQALAQAFGEEYDDLVSTKATKKLQPIIDLLNSNFFKLFPLKEFGISPDKLLEVFLNSPDKVNAFISTIFKLGRHYQIGEEQFYSVALRSYQDMHNNYFGEIEQAAKDFRQENNIEEALPYKQEFLKEVLLELFEIETIIQKLPQEQGGQYLRSYFKANGKSLYINEGMSEAQINFLLAREIGFQYLGLKERPFVTRIIKVTSFEKLLNNFKASYFAAALLMEEGQLTNDIRAIARESKWSPSLFLGLLEKYNVTQEMLLQRLTNILPHHFGIEDLFFLRLAGSEDLKTFHMTKELHLAQLHNPYNNELREHYCRRWVSTGILKTLRTQSSLSNSGESIADAQVSKYWETDKEYFCLSMAKLQSKGSQESVSVTIGLLVNEHLRAVFNFLNDPKLKYKVVHTTCERCSMPDCEARVMAPLVIEKEKRKEQLLVDLGQL